MRRVLIPVVVLVCVVLSAGCARTSRDFVRRNPTAVDVETLQRLKTLRVWCELEGETPEEAMVFLETLGGADIAFDAPLLHERGAVGMRCFNDVPFWTVLQRACDDLGVRCAVRDGVVFVSTAATLAELASEPTIRRTGDFSDFLRRNREVRRRLAGTRVAVDFDRESALDALGELGRLGGVSVVPDRAKFADDAMTVTLKADRMPLGRALDALLGPLRLRYVVIDGLVFVSDDEGVSTTPAPRIDASPAGFPTNAPTRDDKECLLRLFRTRVSVDWDAPPAADAFAELKKKAGVEIVVDGQAPDDADFTVTLRLTDVSPLLVLRFLCEQVNAIWTIRNGVVHITR